MTPFSGALLGYGNTKEWHFDFCDLKDFKAPDARDYFDENNKKIIWPDW